MKKIYEFVCNYGLLLLLILIAVLVLGCLVIPLFVGMGRLIWDAAINNPSALL